MAYFRQRGSSWSFTVDVGRDPVTNKRKQITRSGFDSEAKARIACDQFLAELDQGKDPGRIKLKQFATEYFEKEIIHNVSEGTYITQWQSARDYIFPILGDMFLDKIRHEHIVNFYNRMLNEGRSRATIRNTAMVLKKILKGAVIYSHIMKSPAQHATPPRYAPEKMEIWNKEEIGIFRDSAKDSNLFPLYVLALTSGMRKGEMLALHKSDFDFPNRTVVVTKTLKFSKKSGLHIKKTPKTDNSYRSVKLPQKTIDVIQDYIENKPVDTDIIFDNCGRFYYLSEINRYFDRDIKKSGVKRIRFHDLRHTHVTHLLQKYSVKVVAERIGDTELTVLQTYAHVLPGMQDQVVEFIEGEFF